MTPVVFELEEAKLVEAADSATRVTGSYTVGTTAAAGDAEVTLYVAVLDGEAYPALTAVWDNDDDAIFDAV